VTSSVPAPALRGPVAVLVAVLAGLALTVPAALVAAPPAAAHAALVEADPAGGARLDDVPRSVRLVFTDPLDPGFVRVRVDGPGGAADAEPGVEGDTVTVPVTDAGPGAYEVLYRVVSKDGHPVSGSTTFTVTGEPSATPTPTATTTATATPTVTPAPTAPPSTVENVPTSSEASVGVSPALLAVVGLVVLGALAGAAGLAVSRRRGPSA
jgi:copper resistance protein C